MLLNGVDGDAQLICNLFMRELGFTTHLKNLTLAGSQLLQGMEMRDFKSFSITSRLVSSV